MSNVNKIMSTENYQDEFSYLGSFIRSYRTARGESLQALADRSKVSRSMIGQIESGQTSPTLSVLSKLASAMEIDLADLVKPPESQMEILVAEPKASNKVSKSRSPFVCHMLHQHTRHFASEVYSFHFRRAGRTSFASNVRGSTKSVWLEEGKLTIGIADKTIEVKDQSLISFSSATPHRFISEGSTLARGQFFVCY